MKKINSNLINQIEPDSLRINIAEIEDDVAEKTSKLFYPFQLSRALEPYRGHFILGNHFQGYGGTPEYHEVLGQEIRYCRWLPTFLLGKISEAKPTVLVEKSGREVLSVNTDKNFAEYSMDVGIAVNNSNMPVFQLMSYWVGSDEEMLAFKRALWPQIRDRPIDDMLRSLARKEVKDKQMSKDYLEGLELKIRRCRRSDEARAYTSQVKAIIPKHESTESFVYPVEEEKVKSVLV
jgi:hypothetical protein